LYYFYIIFILFLYYFYIIFILFLYYFYIIFILTAWILFTFTRATGSSSYLLAQHPMPNKENGKIMKYIQFRYGVIIIAVLILGLFSNAHGQDDSKLTIFVDNGYPPYMYKLKGTEADGLYPRLLEEIVKQAGYKVEIKAYPWKRALFYGDAGKGAVGGAYKNDDRVKKYDFSMPLYQEKLVLFVNKNKQFEFNTIEDLKGKVVGVNRGWSYGQEFDTARAGKLFTVNIDNHPNDSFKMLAHGRIDCLILDQLSGESYIRLMGINDQIISLPHAFSINNGYLIIPKKLKMGKFLSEFNSALEKIQKDGTYKNIVQIFIQGTIVN
ncbi:MAG: amino acid ABC transporter substrate-binding protein, partial [Desulfobacteraceae bacterium]|nr:amino acid ABC transporter substrate-binding protein [Desulfobacteraceae bacterium]